MFKVVNKETGKIEADGLGTARAAQAKLKEINTVASMYAPTHWYIEEYQSPDSMIKKFANLDGFRVYKVRNRGDKMGDRLYIAPVYVIGLPGDIDLLNREMATLKLRAESTKLR